MGLNNIIEEVDMTSKKHFTAEEARQIGESLGIDWSKFDVEHYMILYTYATTKLLQKNNNKPICAATKQNYSASVLD